jgi:hypothetical protein
MRAFSTPLLAALLAAAVSPAMAAPAAKSAGAPATGVAGDVRCLMTMFVLAQNKTQPQAAQTGQAGVIFFSGRLSARAPGTDLGPIMKAQAPTLTGPQLQAELQRCGPVMQAAQQNLQAGFTSLRPPGSAPTGTPGVTRSPVPAPPATATAAPPTASGLPPAIPPAAPK